MNNVSDLTRQVARYTAALSAPGTVWERIGDDPHDGVWVVRQGGHGYVVYPGPLLFRYVHTLNTPSFGFAERAVTERDVAMFSRPATHVHCNAGMLPLVDSYPADVSFQEFETCYIGCDGQVNHAGGCSPGTHAERQQEIATALDIARGSMQLRAGSVPSGTTRPASNARQYSSVRFRGLDGEMHQCTYRAGTADMATRPGYCWTVGFDRTLRRELGERYGPWLAATDVGTLMQYNAASDDTRRLTIFYPDDGPSNRMHMVEGLVAGVRAYRPSDMAVHLLGRADRIGGMSSGCSTQADVASGRIDNSITGRNFVAQFSEATLVEIEVARSGAQSAGRAHRDTRNRGKAVVKQDSIERLLNELAAENAASGCGDAHLDDEHDSAYFSAARGQKEEADSLVTALTARLQAGETEMAARLAEYACGTQAGADWVRIRESPWMADSQLQSEGIALLPGFCYTKLVPWWSAWNFAKLLGPYPHGRAVAECLRDIPARGISQDFSIDMWRTKKGRHMWHIVTGRINGLTWMSADQMLGLFANTTAFVGAPSAADGEAFCAALDAAIGGGVHDYAALGGVTIGGGSIAPWHPSWYGCDLLGNGAGGWQSQALFRKGDDNKHALTSHYFYVSGFVEAALCESMHSFAAECKNYGITWGGQENAVKTDAELAALRARVAALEHEVLGDTATGIGCLGFALADVGIAADPEVRRLADLTPVQIAQFRCAIKVRGQIYVRYLNDEKSKRNHIAWAKQGLDSDNQMTGVTAEYFDNKLDVCWYATTEFEPQSHSGLNSKVQHIEEYLYEQRDNIKAAAQVHSVREDLANIKDVTNYISGVIGSDAGQLWSAGQLRAIWQAIALMSGKNGTELWNPSRVSWPRCSADVGTLHDIGGLDLAGGEGADAAQRDGIEHAAGRQRRPVSTGGLRRLPPMRSSYRTLKGLTDTANEVCAGLQGRTDGEYTIQVRNGIVSASLVLPGTPADLMKPDGWSYCRAQLQKVDRKLGPFKVENVNPDHATLNWSAVDSEGYGLPGAHLMLSEVPHENNADDLSDAGSNHTGGGNAEQGTNGTGGGDAEGDGAHNGGANPAQPDPAANPNAHNGRTRGINMSNRIKAVLAGTVMLAFSQDDMPGAYGIKRMMAMALVGSVAMTESVKEALSDASDRAWLVRYDAVDSDEERLDIVMHQMELLMQGDDHDKRRKVCIELLGVNPNVFDHWDRFPAVRT